MIRFSKVVYFFSLCIVANGLVSNRKLLNFKTFEIQVMDIFKNTNKFPTSISIKMTQSSSSSSTSTSNLMPFINTQELTSRLDSMPLSEKYILLIESYTKDILQAKENNKLNKSQLMESIESLYTEMIQQPNDFKADTLKQATSSLLTSASFFFNTIQLGQSIQLAKAGMPYTFATSTYYHICI